MVTLLDFPIQQDIIYPESDGQPMADNTLQFTWIVTIKENNEVMFWHDPNVFVAGDLLWYPVEGNPKIRVAPDVMIVFGRPKGHRGSYQQWKEDNIPPQVVFEILSPGNTAMEMSQKFAFFNRYGTEEYYLYNPYTGEFQGWVREDNLLTQIDEISGWVSPRLGVRFVVEQGELMLYRPDGRRFLTFVELQQQADAERQRAERLAAQLRALGIAPEA